MFIVQHYNFGTAHFFNDLAEAKAFAIKACFDAYVCRSERQANGSYTYERVGSFTPIGGWRD